MKTMKTIVSNNCLGARIYTLLNRQYDNPFMWCLISPYDYFTLMENFDSIDFTDVVPRIQQDSPMNQNTNVVTLRIGGLIDIPYVHHHEDKDCDEVKTIGVDKYYKNMRQYVCDAFSRRIKRMSPDIIFLFEGTSDVYSEFSKVKAQHKKVFVSNDKTLVGNNDVLAIWNGGKSSSMIKARYILENSQKAFQ